MTFFDHTPIPEGVHGHDGRLPYDPRENALTIAGDTPEEFAGPRLFAPPPPPPRPKRFEKEDYFGISLIGPFSLALEVHTPEPLHRPAFTQTGLVQVERGW